MKRHPRTAPAAAPRLPATLEQQKSDFTAEGAPPPRPLARVAEPALPGLPARPARSPQLPRSPRSPQLPAGPASRRGWPGGRPPGRAR